MVQYLTWAHRNAGRAEEMRFSYYGQKRLETQAQKKRIAYMAIRAGHGIVTLDEVTRVLAGDQLHPRRKSVQEFVRKAAVLCEAARQFGYPGEPTTPEFFVTYLDFLKRGNTLWSRFVSQSKERLLKKNRRPITPPVPVVELYKWINGDALVANDPILRTATLYWGLSLLYPQFYDLSAIDAIMDHELRTGFINLHGLMLFPNSELGQPALALAPSLNLSDDDFCDLTSYFESFTLDLNHALTEHNKTLKALIDSEDGLPWLMVRPPDELDRQIFEIIERQGSARSQEILASIPNPPPLRTLQRRLQRLCRDGLLAKQGARKFAFYRIAEHI